MESVHVVEPPTTSSLLAHDELFSNVGADHNRATTNQTPSCKTERIYPFVQVAAPETLSGGFTFDVEVDHGIFTVKVPTGGVVKGQVFKAKTQPRIMESNRNLRVPMGGWKDSLFDFCRYGPFHSSLCLAAFCPLVALGQVYTRLGLSWNALPQGDVPKSSRSFKIMVLFSILYWSLMQIISPYNHRMIHYTTLLVLCFVAFLAGRTRSYIRHRYDIPAEISSNPFVSAVVDRFGCEDYHENHTGNGCEIAEDYFIACICQPCVISQMNRHTALYDTYEGSCCSSNGLPTHAPTMVV